MWLTLRDISEVCSMIQRLNSYNLRTDKVTEKGQSKSLLLRFPSTGKKISPVKFPIPPNPLPLFGRPQHIKLNGSFLWKGCNCLKAIQSHYEETVSFHQKFLVLIKSISKGWMAEMTLKPSSGFELVYQPSYYQI